MKIGIVTLHIGHNYGGIVQNWALQQVLKRMGHEPVTLGTTDRHIADERLSVGKKIKLFVRTRRRKWIGLPRFEWYRAQRKKMGLESLFEGNERFVETEIVREKVAYKHRRKWLTERGIEALVVGSDQVWRPEYSGMRTAFLDFAEGMEMPKVAYAASFGVSEWEYSPRQTALTRKRIEAFTALSVREESGVSLVGEHWGRAAKWVLDPTMLLTKEDYMPLAENIEVQPCVWGYILDKTPEKTALLDRVGALVGTGVRQPVVLHNSLRNVREYRGKSMDVREWLAGFRDAEYVVVDSFHGAVFSILFEKPFWIIGNVRRGYARFESLLKIVGLEARIGEHPTREQLMAPIDWADVKARIESRREEALGFLREALEAK